jgi:hypothetical protein
MVKKNSLAAALRDGGRNAPAPKRAPDAGGDRRLIAFRLEPEVIHQIKLLGLNEGKTLQDLICEGINSVFKARKLPQIAK